MNDDATEPKLTKSDLEKIGKDWLERIAAADEREKAWRDAAESAEAAYSCDKNAKVGDVPAFNILHSNIETIVPAIYNSTPSPDIRPRHNKPDPEAKEMADVFERAIAAAIDDDVLDVEMESVAQDSELAGRGILWLKFDSVVNGDVVTDERVIYEAVAWRDYREGPAKRWQDVPWVSRTHTITGVEMRRISDDAMLEAQISEHDTTADMEAKDFDVLEIWEKESRKVFFVVEDTGRVLNIKDDPMGLEGFFPCLEPVQPLTLTGKRTPICPYSPYKPLAEELDRITRRINKIISGLKVRGLIAGGVAEDLERLALADDNSLEVAANLESLVAAGGDLNRAIAWWPVGEAIAVLRELYTQREQVKQTIYEVTGISDIVRGASNSGETATAQQIKTQWGSLRIKRLQRALQRTVRDAFKMTAEIISLQFSPETVARMAGVELTEELASATSRPFDHFRIDVESDSTVRADLTQRKGEMSEFLQGTAQYMQVAGPLIAETPQAAGPLMEVFSAFSRQFSLGKQAEDAIDEMVSGAKEMAQQEKPDPAAEAMARDEDRKDRAEQREDQRFQLDVAKFEADTGLKSEEFDLKERRSEFDAVKNAAEFELEVDQERPVRIGDELSI